MPDRNPKQEIRRIRNLLLKMAETAEHAEQTGSFESGVRNYVKRYNAIVEHLEEEDILPEELFSELDEDETNFGQLGAESTLLADYISDIVEETPVENAKREHKEGLGPLIALAPFLGSSELSKLVRERLGVTVTTTSAPTPPPPPHGPDLQTIIGLAPHVDKETVGQLVRAALAQHKVSDPSLLVALAPHMDKAEFSQLVREQLPGWFSAQPAPDNAPKQEATSTSGFTVSWGDSFASSSETPPAPPAPPTPPSPPTPPHELR